MALEVQPPDGRRRVKVYELRDNDWFDRGTGFCTGQILGVSRASPSRRDDADASSRATIHTTLIASLQEEPRIFVESEDQPNRVLLETKITKDDGYQKQQGTASDTAQVASGIWHRD